MTPWTDSAGPDRDLVRAVEALIDDIVASSDTQPVDEARWAGLRDGDPARLVADDDMTGAVLTTPAADRLAVIDLIAGPDTDDDVAIRLVTDAVDDARRGHDRVEVWVQCPGDRLHSALEGLGLSAQRELLELRVPLPIEDTTRLSTRAMVPGDDDDSWLAVNNAAFAWHPEQGGWTVADLEARRAEDWFAAEDVRVHDVDGVMAGFCWTKRHAERGLGEIYVIAVHPDFVGRGLGRGLTEAGLAYLASEVDTGMLYVEGDNEPAVGLYRSMGFTTHHRVRAYRGSA